MQKIYDINWSEIFYHLTIILFFVSLICSASVKHRFRKYSRVKAASGLTGAEAADRILRSNGIVSVDIMVTGGVLTDNYDPVRRNLNLSEPVCYESSVAAIAVAAHECGHAIQHAQLYSLLMIRKAFVPICNIGSAGSYVAIFLGLVFSSGDLITLGAALFSGIVLFNLITLPVEINASKRALAEIERLNLLTEDELRGGRKVLTAAAMTYFVALMVSLVQLLRMLSLARRRN